MREVSIKFTILLTFIFVCALFSCERRSLGSEHTVKQTKALKHEVSILSDSVMMKLERYKDLTSLRVRIEWDPNYEMTTIQILTKENVQLFSYHVFNTNSSTKKKERFFSHAKSFSCTINGKADKVFIYDGFEFYPGCGIIGQIMNDPIMDENIHLFYRLFHVS